MKGDGFLQDQEGYYIEVGVDDVLDFGFTWDGWLKDDHIANSTWSAPDGLTISSSTYDSTETAALISGFAAGSVYTVTNTVQTAAGLRTRRSFRLIVEA